MLTSTIFALPRFHKNLCVMAELQMMKTLHPLNLFGHPAIYSSLCIIFFRPFPISGNWLCVTSMGIIPLCFICDSMVSRMFFSKMIEHLLGMYN